MSSYGQWSKAFASHGPARVTWVCGSERLLVHEVVDALAVAIGPDEVEVWTAGRDREKDIWASVLSVPFAASRLVLIHNAEKLKSWDSLSTWLLQKQSLRGCSLVFESQAEDFPHDKEGKLAEPCTWLRDSTVGHIVRCMPLSPDDAVVWSRRQMPGLSARQAVYLLERASGDLREVRTVLTKARLFSGNLTEQALAALCNELPGDFVDKLITGDRQGAMLAAESLGSDGLGFSLGLLASRLDVLASLHRAARDNVSRRDVVAKLGVPAFLAQKYAGVAKDYGEQRVARCWGALAAVEDAYRSGSAVGAAEVLVAAW